MQVMREMKIHKGDQVKIISGNDRGKSGKVLAILSGAGKVVVEGINIRKKHVRARRAGQKGELVRIPAPLSVSRAMLICRSCGKEARVGTEFKSGRKYRVCKKCRAEL